MTNTELSDAGRSLRRRKGTSQVAQTFTDFLLNSSKEERACLAELLDCISADYLARMPDLSPASKEQACAAVRQLQKLADGIELNNCNANVLIV